MKKISFLYLTIIVLVVFSICFLPTITCSNDGTWKEVFSYISDDERQTITIYQEDTTWCWGYNSRLKLVAKEIEESESTISIATYIYISKQYTTFSQPVSEDKLYQNDKNLRKLEIQSNVESLRNIRLIMDNPTAYLLNNTKKDYLNVLEDELSKSLTGEIDSFFKNLIGVKTPVKDFVDTINDNIELNNLLQNKYEEMRKMLTLPLEQALESLDGEEGTTAIYFKDLYKETADELFDKIVEMHTETTTEIRQIQD